MNAIYLVLLPICLTLAASGIAWGAVQAHRFVAAHLGAGRVRDALDRGIDAAKTAALVVEQTFAAGVRKPDGSLDPSHAGAALKLAEDKARSYLGVEGVRQLATALVGVDVATWLTGRIESFVPAVKALSAAGSPATPPRATGVQTPGPLVPAPLPPA